MSLPPGFLDELRSRVSLSQVAGRKVMWDARKSNQGKGDLWAPCPFHQEKTASFHVDDRKGYYYCFGCHAKGDAITFVRETENVSFMEAVEILAGEAGMQMPARDPQAQAKTDHRTQLVEVMELAVKHFQMQLKTGAGREAREYLQRRGLNEAALARWELGFAQDAWQGLWDHLTGKGVAPDLILGAGLAKPSQKGGRPYDTFRGRIQFPIRDARGRCIAFGGRAMDPNDGAKYLNSPETDLFDKSRTLFNHGPARQAAGKGQSLIVAEGYMDVIALSEAGFGASVAPLGTAVTETQLAMLWRISDEPIIALDGDTAGLRAAMRVIDLALPLLEAGKSLRFALMPNGQDPDDVIRAGGAGALQKLLDAAQPMVQLLWQREIEGKSFDSPERKAALDKALRDKIKSIKDPSIRQHYGQAIKDLRWQLFRPNRGPSQGYARGGFKHKPTVQTRTRSSILASGAQGATERLRQSVVLATLLRYPDLIPEFEAELEQLPCAGDLAEMQRLLLQNAVSGAQLMEVVVQKIGPYALDDLLSQPHLSVVPCLRHLDQPELARLTLAEQFGKIFAVLGHSHEVAEAEEEIIYTEDETLTHRLRDSSQSLQPSQVSADLGSSEFVIADNGAAVDKDEQSAFEALLKTIQFSKPHR